MALPFLHRVQLRIRQAVEDAPSGGAMLRRLDEVSERMERIEAHLRADRSASEDLSGRMERIEAHLSAETGTAGQAMNRLDTRLNAAQIGIDALRIEQTALVRDVTERDPRTMLETLTSLLNERADALDGRLREGQAALADRVQDRADLIYTLLRDRTDKLLSRVALPSGDSFLMRTPEGYLFIPAEDTLLAVHVYDSGGRLEPGTISVIQALLREGDTALDVGANVGLTVLPAARRVGPSGRVIAVEPVPRIAGLLRRSLVLNGLDGIVSLHLCAAGDEAGKAVLNVGTVYGHSSLLDLPDAQGSETVEVRTLDSLVPPGTAIRLAKIDVEGFEPQAWRGMGRILSENPEMAVLVEFGPSHLRRAGITPEAWLAPFTGAGFTAYEVEELTGAIRPARPAPALAELVSVNLLMLRQPPGSYPGLRPA